MSEQEGGWQGVVSPVAENVVRAGGYEELDRGREGGMYGNRAVIGEGTRINRGVYLVGGPGEACVVDDQICGQLNNVYDQLLDRMARRGNGYKGYILQDVVDLARERIPYNRGYVESVSNGLRLESGGRDGAKISLGDYVDKGGVSRHQALLAGYLLERLKDNKYLRGGASIEREFVPGVGCRARVRYTAYDGSEYVLDPARNLLGELGSVGEKRDTGTDAVVRRFGSALEIMDPGSHVVEEHLADLGMLPEGLVRKLVAGGLKIKLADRDVINMTVTMRVRQPPRGWNGQADFRGVPGVYFPDKKKGYLGAGMHGSISMPLHEVGHGMGGIFGLDNKKELVAAHRRLYPKLVSYLQQGGPGAAAGRQEMLAEAFAVFFKKSKSEFVREYDGGLYSFLDKEIKKAG